MKKNTLRGCLFIFLFFWNSSYASSTEYIDTLTSADKLKLIDWNNVDRDLFDGMKTVEQIDNGSVTTVQESNNVLINNIEFDEIKLLRINSTNAYRVVLIKESKKEYLCSKYNLALEEIWGKPNVRNDRTNSLLNISTQWTLGNTWTKSWCSGSPSKNGMSINNIFFVLMSNKVNHKEELPIIDLACKMEYIIDFEKPHHLKTWYIRLDETNKSILNQANGEIGSDAQFEENSIEFIRKSSNEVKNYPSMIVTGEDTFRINRFSGDISGNGFSSVNGREKIFGTFSGHCNKIDKLKKQF